MTALHNIYSDAGRQGLAQGSKNPGLITLSREVLLASVHTHKNYHHSNRRMTFRLKESIEKFAR